jgi:hypothetical protein
VGRQGAGPNPNIMRSRVHARWGFRPNVSVAHALRHVVSSNVPEHPTVSFEVGLAGVACLNIDAAPSDHMSHACIDFAAQRNVWKCGHSTGYGTGAYLHPPRFGLFTA